MPYLSVHVSGLDEARTRLAAQRARLQDAVLQGVQAIADQTVAALSAAAPRGKSGSSGGGNEVPLDGDAPGPLSTSFSAEAAATGEISASAPVLTSQPRKLALVRGGRGPVSPRQKRALMWAGLDHPVSRAGPAAANDFVAPVLADMRAQAGEIMREAVMAALAAE